MPSRPPSVLVVSKPLGPPWNDGSKNLARDLVEGLAEADPERRMRAFVPRGAAAVAGCHAVSVATATLSRRTVARMLATLATERDSALWHFLFAPNRRTSSAAAALARARGRATVQTLASAPGPDVRLAQVTFGDRVVALSRATEARALAEGVRPERLRRIAPAIAPPPPPTPEAVRAVREDLALGGAGAGSFVVTFPGDLEHGCGAALILEACARASSRRDLVLVMACRPKGPRSIERRHTLDARARAGGLAVRWVGETPSIHALLRASDLVALPTDTLYAKVDHPLVLLEAMHLGRPVLVTQGTAAYELAEEGGAIGTALDADAIAAVIDSLISETDAAERAGAAARRHAAGRTREAMARAYATIYDELR